MNAHAALLDPQIGEEGSGAALDKPSAVDADDRLSLDPTTAELATIELLNDLIEVSKDSEIGFRLSAEYTFSPQLRTVFEDRANQCRSAAAALRAHVSELGGAFDAPGNMHVALHRVWGTVKGPLSTFDDAAILEECERGESTALDIYGKALTRGLPPHIHKLVERQYKAVQRNRELVRRLRASFKSF